MPELPSLEDRIRSAIESDERSAYRLAIDSGVPAPTLSRFVRGLAGLSATSAEQLMAALGFTIADPPRKKRPAKKAGNKA